MKKIFVFVFSLICLLPLFAAESFYSPSYAQFLVDLSSTTYYSHESNVDSTKWTSGKPDSNSDKYKYYDDQMIGTYGVTSLNSKSVTFKITNSDGWYYIDSDGNKRPYGIDLILKTDHDEYYDYNEAGPVIHMGFQDSSNITGTTEKSSTAEFTISYTYYTMQSAWVDICLVLPKFTDDSNVKASKNTFTGRITIAVSSDTLTETSQVIDLSGNFLSTTDTTSSDLQAVVSIVPTLNASNLDIANAKGKQVSVAKYLFTTEYKNMSSITYSNNSAYLFLSSNKNGSLQGSKFTLKLIGSSSTDGERSTSVNFVAYLCEGDSFVDSTAKMFDGTTTSSSVTESFLTAKYEEVLNNAGVTKIKWSSEGYIYVQIPDEAETSSLFGGDYTSTIYVHVVSPE